MKKYLENLFNIFKDRKNSIDEVPYVASKDVERYIKRWLKNNGIKNISFGNILFQIEFDSYKAVRLSKKSDGKDNFIQYQVGDVKNNIEFVDLPKPKIVVHGNENYSFVGYRFNNEDKNNVFLVKNDEYIHKVYEDGFQLRERIINNGTFLYVKFVYANDTDEKITFSHVDYDFDDSCYFSKKNDSKFQEYIRNLEYPVSIIDVYNEICGLFKIDNNNDNSRNTYLEISDKKTGYSASLFIGDNDITIQEDDFELKYVRKGNVSEINICNGDFVFSIRYKKDFNDKLSYCKEEELIKYLMKIRFPISIIDLYKDLCSCSLLIPDNCSELTLRYLNGISNMTTIKFIDGNFEEIEVMEKGKVVQVNKEDTIFTNKSLLDESLETLEQESGVLSKKRVPSELMNKK